ncbi:class I SAM-dependent methyltransferase [Streptomonospora sp. PA3]|uniref:class I SAM-dependent methyltransferase n=1 Tax=Streptomonospora sp. PA3 TaxID=2607326 RepID=UPI0012DEE6B7|nr:methyltransferase [Streptomonospora sp. PA3]MUL42024.1 class I SAM-dependent methyltransferase [Streptomonospora sp. PA3]
MAEAGTGTGGTAPARAPERRGGRGYAFDNDGDHAAEQHECLAAAYDPVTTRRLARTGVGAGWRCLEVGAGGGSVGVWLARRVAPEGRAVVTDIKPARIPREPAMAVRRHDIVRDALPERAFDLIHARLVLMHLPEREDVLARLFRALRPGGWLQLDELDATRAPGLLMPDAAAGRLFDTFQRAKLRALEASGADPAWGARAPAAMRRAGFAEVDPQPHVTAWRAGSPGARLQAHHTRHLRDALIGAGMTEAELRQLRRLFSCPDFCACSPVFYTVQGRRP